MIVWMRVKVRGLWYLVTGRSMHRSGLTVPCHGCNSTDPHDAHLAAGTLVYLGRAR
jgi:hypothetical protein